MNETHTPVQHGVLQDKRVLVVEDEEDARELLDILLSGEGAIVASAASAEEALEKLDGFVPDVLLSDIGLPGADGYWLIRKVRERYPSLPAIALTAFTRTSDVQRAHAEGFDQHVAKPVEPTKLVAVIAMHANRSKLTTE